MPEDVDNITINADKFVLKAGSYYASRDYGCAKILEVNVHKCPEGKSAIGYWLYPGHAHQWLPDGTSSEKGGVRDLICEINEEEALQKEKHHLEADCFYWNLERSRIAKILVVGVRFYTQIFAFGGNRDTKLGVDPCIGYWLDAGVARSWNPDGTYRHPPEPNEDFTLYRGSKASPEEVSKYICDLNGK